MEAIAYHAIRELFLSRFNKFLTGLQVFLGTSAIAALTDVVSFGPLGLLILSSLAGVILLVVDPAGGAREHRTLRTRLHTARAALESHDSEKSARAALAELQRVSADAPPAYRGVQAVAYNTAVNALYEESMAVSHRYRIGFWRRFFAQYFPMRSFKFVRE